MARSKARPAQYLRHATLCLSVFLTTACASTAPPAQDVPRLVAQAVPFYAGTVVFAADGQWYPDAGDFRMSLTAEPVPGMVIVTTESVMFARWDDMARRYRVLKRVQFIDLTDASVDTFLFSARAVLKNNDMARYGEYRTARLVLAAWDAQEAASLKKTA